MGSSLRVRTTLKVVSDIPKQRHLAVFRANGQTFDIDEYNLIRILDMLKVCVKEKDLNTGIKLHSDITAKVFFANDVVVANALVNMYAKCGALEKAHVLFTELAFPTVVSWNTLIAGYAQHGYGNDAWTCFERMHLQGFIPNAVSFSCILKACKFDGKVQQIHVKVASSGLLQNDNSVGPALLDIYIKHCRFYEAENVFDEISENSVVSWNVLITGYTQYKLGQKAIMCFEQMCMRCIFPDGITFSGMFKACGSLMALDEGKRVHLQVLDSQFLEKDIVVANALVDMYVKCCAVIKAQEVFDELPNRDVVSWNVLISGYSEHGYESLRNFEQMQMEGFCPDQVTYICVLRACSILEALNKGEEIYARIKATKFLEKNLELGNAFVDMYAKCSAFQKAQTTLNNLPLQNVVSWNSLIAAYAQHGYGELALEFFDHMIISGISPNAVTFICLLKACGSIGAAQKGQEIHAKILKEGLLVNNCVLASALVDMYGKCGLLQRAQEVFDQFLDYDVVLWNALIAGYAQHGHAEEAFKIFEQMQRAGLPSDIITFVCILKVCSGLGAISKTQEIHSETLKRGLLKNNEVLGNALVDVYAKFGMVDEAQNVFDRLLDQDLVSTNALMSGFAQLTEDEIVVASFNKMILDGKEPNHITFIILLNMCCHIGLVHEGHMYLESMDMIYGVTATLDHYACLVDLFGRSGQIENVFMVMNHIPLVVNITLWNIVLSACQRLGNICLARLAFAYALELEINDAATYICMRNAYSVADREPD